MPPNTKVTISRLTQLDAYGDPQDINSEPVAIDVPAVFAYAAKITQDPATGTPRQVTTYSCLLPKGTDVRDDDRITDQQTNITYAVTGVTIYPSYGIPADVWVVMTAVGG
jgi:hypothetical protein